MAHMDAPNRECYSVTGNYRTRVWVAFLEWPRPGETAGELVQRLHMKYQADYAQPTFDIEVSRYQDGTPKYALVRLRTLDVEEV